MLYSKIPQTLRTTIQKDEKGYNLEYDIPHSYPDCWNCRIPFHQPIVVLNKNGEGRSIKKNEAAEVFGLIHCAAALYIFTDNHNKILNIGAFHAHSGMIPKNELPTAKKYNQYDVPLKQIHVVFASGLNAAELAYKSADGYIDMLNIGIPHANMRLLANAGGKVVMNNAGEVGLNFEKYWYKGKSTLRETLISVADTAIKTYTALPSSTSNKIFSSKPTIKQTLLSINAFTSKVDQARNDEACLKELENFLKSQDSYKQNSIGLLFAQQLYSKFQPVIPKVLTKSNGKLEALQIITGIRAGRL